MMRLSMKTSRVQWATPGTPLRQTRVRVASSSQDGQVDQAQAFEEGLAALAKQALQNDPEAAAQLKRYEAAVVRLEKAKAAEKELERIMADAARAAVEEDAAEAAGARARADQVLADAEVAAAERLLRAAQIEYGMAADEKRRLSGAAFSEADRGESAKAAAVAAAGGLAATLPFALAAGAGAAGELLSLGDAAACCALFGVTYRYAVREDGGNVHLRTGAVAAFALVRAAGGFDLLQRAAVAAAAAADGGSGGGIGALGAALSPDVVGPAALYAGVCVATFGAAAAALEAAFSGGFVRRMRGSASA